MLRELILAITCCWLASTAMAQPGSIPLDRAAQLFELAQRLAAADDADLWGVSLAGPLFFVDPETRDVVANQADSAGQFTAAGALWTGKLPEHLFPANTSIEWGGVRWTMVMWSSLQGSRYDCGRLLMHESFHRIQPELGFEARNPGNAHLDGELGRIWLRLEMRALAEALIREGDQRRRAAADALIFRAIRHSLVGETQAQEETALDANEGLAEYTGLRLSGLPPKAQEQRLAADLERRDGAPTLSRSFAYATGPALAMLLDELEPGWRATAAAHPNLAERLAVALQFQYPDDDSAVAIATAIANDKYDGRQVFEGERDRAVRREARLAEFQAQFAPDKVLIIESSADFRYAFNPNTAESLDAQRIFYKPLSASDAWGSIEAPEGAVIDFNPPMKLMLPIADGDTAESVSWRLELNPNYELDTTQAGAWRIRLRK